MRARWKSASPSSCPAIAHSAMPNAIPAAATPSANGDGRRSGAHDARTGAQPRRSRRRATSAHHSGPSTANIIAEAAVSPARLQESAAKTLCCPSARATSAPGHEAGRASRRRAAGRARRPSPGRRGRGRARAARGAPRASGRVSCGQINEARRRAADAEPEASHDAVSRYMRPRSPRNTSAAQPQRPEHQPPRAIGLARAVVLREEPQVAADVLLEHPSAVRGAAHVDDLRARVEDHGPARLVEAVAPVGLLAEEEERAVRRADGVDRVAADEQCTRP